MEPNIELSKTRDFGEIIADSFLFIRQNLKALLSCFFVFSGFFLLAGTVANIMQQINLSDAINSAGFAEIGSEHWATIYVPAILTGLFTLLMYVTMPVALLSFIALYKEKGNVAPTNEEVWGYFKFYFFRILLGSILNFIILIVGFLLCIIPGIYFYAVLGLVFPIMVVENTSYSYAFNQSFRLIKENWWMVFGVLFVTGLIVSICSAVVSVPFQAVNLWSVYLHQVKNVHMSMISIVLGTILQQLALVLYILPLVALALCYFSLTESKDATGLMGRIDQLGHHGADTNVPEEEY